MSELNETAKEVKEAVTRATEGGTAEKILAELARANRAIERLEQLLKQKAGVMNNMVNKMKTKGILPWEWDLEENENNQSE